jgi:phosphoribosylformimino-5-aminoimidazole carboxamide ribonucleotide (ProFAR) isomerase
VDIHVPVYIINGPIQCAHSQGYSVVKKTQIFNESTNLICCTTIVIRGHVFSVWVIFVTFWLLFLGEAVHVSINIGLTVFICEGAWTGKLSTHELKEICVFKKKKQNNDFLYTSLNEDNTQAGLTFKMFMNFNSHTYMLLKIISFGVSMSSQMQLVASVVKARRKCRYFFSETSTSLFLYIY